MALQSDRLWCPTAAADVAPASPQPVSNSQELSRFLWNFSSLERIQDRGGALMIAVSFASIHNFPHFGDQSDGMHLKLISWQRPGPGATHE